MNTRFAMNMKLFLCAVLVLGVVSCGGGGGGDDDSSTPAAGDASAAKAATNTVMALGSAIGGSSSDVVDRPETLPKGFVETDVTINCDMGGTARVQGLLTWVTTFQAKVTNTFASEMDVTLNKCDQIDGELSMSVTGSSNHPLFSYLAVINGSVTDSSEGSSCTISTDGLTFDVDSNWESDDYTATVSGTVTGTCDGESVTCTWSSVNADDEAAIEAGCGL